MGEPILALVNYVDYEREPVRVNVHLSEYFYKRASFAHENELRAILQRVPLVPISWDKAGNVTGRIMDLKAAPIPGVALKVDLTRLIERVHVAPGAPEWLANLVRNVVVKYALNIPVHQSGLDSKPVY
jgi:hypothetical protein